jgi:hypothetical protein
MRRKLLVAFALSTLAGSAALARPAAGLTEPSVDGEPTSSAGCGRGHRYLCFYMVTYQCSVSSLGVCMQYVQVITPYFRD